MAELVCIVNPQSCAGRTAERWPEIARQLTAAGLAHEVRMTAAPGDGTRLTREALLAGAATVVAVGGDGTIHEVANGFFDGATPIAPEARLGIVPGGSGSDLIKTLGIPADAAGAIARLARGEARALDVGLACFTNHRGEPEARVYLNSASAGLTGDVLAIMRELPGFLKGQAAYVAASVMGLLKLQPFDVTVTFDEEPPVERRAFMVVVGNGRYFGAGMQVLPKAVMDDGLFDVLIGHDRPMPELLMNFPRLYTGTHLGLSLAEWRRAGKVSLAGPRPVRLELDGEQPGVTPATFEVLPGAIQVVV